MALNTLNPPTSPRVWGRVDVVGGGYQWVAVAPDANGSKSYLCITWLIQVLELVMGESPLYANWGIPAYQSVMTQIYPDFYVQQVQQQFSPYFAILRISKVSGLNYPAYTVNLTTFEGTVHSEVIAV